MITRIIVLLILCGAFSCAHYFPNEKSNNFLTKIVNENKSICIYEAEKFELINEKKIIEKENILYGDVIKRIENNGFNINCNEAENSLKIVLISTEKKNVLTDFNTITFGIIPGKIAKSYEVYGFFGSSLKPEYYSLNRGNVWLSIFFVPFFFLHEHNNDVIFGEIVKYLKLRKKQMQIK